MLPEKITNILNPLEDESLDEFLIRSLKDEEIKKQLISAVSEELKNEHDQEMTFNLERMNDILLNPDNKKFGIHPDLDGKEALWEVVFSRPVNYNKDIFLAKGDVNHKNKD